MQLFFFPELNKNLNYLFMEKTTLVLGASSNPERYSNRAVKSLQRKNIPVIAIGRRDHDNDGLKITKGVPADLP